VTEYRKDDVGTQFYRCKNNHETATPIKKEYEPMPYGNYEDWCIGGKFSPARLAKDLIDNYAIRTNIETDELFIFNVNSGIYDRHGDVLLRRIIDNCLEMQSTHYIANEVIYLIHVKTSDKLQESKKIAVLNGILNVQTGELQKPTPNEFVTVQIPVTYDKNAVCPEILKFFSEVSPADMKPMFEEIFGYCLYRELPIHKATVLLGEGRNGKTTFLKLFIAFLGLENVSQVTLQEMCEGKFELAELKGKLANIVDDLPGKALKTVGTFKWVTGNAPIMAQYKHKNPFTFWPTVKHLFGCNKLPKPSEDTIAYFSRFNIVPFTRLFIGKTDDKDKLEKITTPTELSGLLNLALAGLKRLLQNGDFTNSKTIEENRELYIRSSDSCKAFAEEQLEESSDPKDFIATETIYQEYVKYCQEKRLPTIESKPKLFQAIRQTFPNAEVTKQRVGNTTSWVWQYLTRKSVPSVPSVPPVCIWENFNYYNTIKKHTEQTEHAEQNSIIEKELVASHCRKFHSAACPEPHPDCIVPVNPCPKTCGSFEANEK
jgi:putative DNA primase/helicase